MEKCVLARWQLFCERTISDKNNFLLHRFCKVLLTTNDFRRNQNPTNSLDGRAQNMDQVELRKTNEIPLRSNKSRLHLHRNRTADEVWMQTTAVEQSRRRTADRICGFIVCVKLNRALCLWLSAHQLPFPPARTRSRGNSSTVHFGLLAVQMQIIFVSLKK